MDPRAALHERYAHHFPVRQRLLYLNHAAVAPLCKPAADAMRHMADDCCEFGSLHYQEWLGAYDGLRAAAARLTGATPAEIALMKNTSEGISTVALGLDWKPGDRMVGFHEEFPSNLYPWKRLEARGVEVTWLSVFDSLDRIDEACRGAKLLSVSFVGFLNGYRAPIREIGEICKRHGCIYFVDAIQGLGAFPLDVRECHIDALAADGHKWMLGPEGCGIFYISQALQERVEPVEFGWMNAAGNADYASRDMTPYPDARRYECGTLNTIGCFGLRASIELLLEIGIGNVAAAVQGLADRIADGVRAKGYELIAERTPASSAGIVSFRKPGVDSAELVQRLSERGITAAPRAGWVRTSPHFYIAPTDIDRLLSELP
jgi:selenocysteine lyase/cysteine desulfurase